MSKIRFKKPSPALVVAVIALFVGLSGGAYAAKVGTNQLKAKSVTTGKIAGKAVTKGKIGGQSVTTGKIAGQAVTESKLGSEAVTTDKLAGQAVTESELADLSVTTDKLAGQAVTESELADQSVTKGKLGDGAVGAAKLGPIATRSQTATIPNGASGTVTAQCNSGEKVLSGGWDGPPMNGTTVVYLASADKKSGEGWTASAFNLGVPVQVTVYAYCLQQ